MGSMSNSGAAGDGDGDGGSRLSELPHDALLRIVSFLPSAEAARLSVVSSRFRSLFPQIPSLRFRQSDFPSSDPSSRRLACYTQRVLLGLLAHSGGSPIESFHLSARFIPGDIPSSDRLFLLSVDQCLRLALRKGATDIRLDLEECDDLPCHPRFRTDRLSYCAANLEMDIDDDDDSGDEDDVKSIDDTECLRSFYGYPPDSEVEEYDGEYSDDDEWEAEKTLNGGLFSSSLLQVLHLRGCRLNQFPLEIKFNSLHSLVLDSVKIVNNQLQRLLDSCPVLENLELQRCRTDSKLSISSCPQLKKFMLLCCHNISSLYVDAQQLLEFEYQGEQPSKNMIVFVGSPNLIMAKFIFCNDFFDDRGIEDLLANFRQSKSLYLSSKSVQDFAFRRAVSSFTLLVLHGIKFLELKGEFFHIDAAHAVMDMLDSTPHLEHLSLRFTDLDNEQRKDDYYKTLEGGLYCDHLQYNCLQNHLKKMRIQPFGNKLLLKTLKLIFSRAAVLEEVTLVGFPAPFSRHLRMKRMLESFLANPKTRIIYL